MTPERYKLNNLARAELDDLRAAGIEPTDDEIIRINGLASEVLSPEARRCLSRGRPFPAGTAWLWPLTIAASAWFEDTGCNLRDPHAALGYAMAHGDDPALDTAGEAEVRAWFRRLRCRRAELDLAIAACIEQDEQGEIPRREDDRIPTAGEISAVMVATVGGNPAMWERQCSITYVRAVLETLGEQQRAGSGKVAPAVARATMALGMACERIKERGRKDG